TLRRRCGRPGELRRLEVSSHAEIGMGLRHGRLRIENQTNPIVDAELFFDAIPIDRAAVDVLEHEVRLSRAGQTSVDEPADMRMREARQDHPLALETLLRRAAEERGIQQLDGDVARKPAIAA